MKFLFIGGCAVLALQVGVAQAGPCTAEIDNLTKTLASMDAGAGPTSGAITRETTGARPSADPKSGKEQHPPTETMSRATQGGAASPQDVQRQTEGQPTAAEQAKGRVAGGSGNRAAASAALDRARALDQEGKLPDCVDAINEARRHLGN